MVAFEEEETLLQAERKVKVASRYTRERDVPFYFYDSFATVAVEEMA